MLEIDRSLLLDNYTTFVDYPCYELPQELRKVLSLNQSEIAAKIGVAQSNYSAWERGVRTPRRQEYKNIFPLIQKASITLLEKPRRTKKFSRLFISAHSLNQPPFTTMISTRRR